MPRWRIIRGQPPRALYGGELVATIDAPTGNAAIEEYARANGRAYSRVNNDRIQFDGDAPFTIGFLDVTRDWPTPPVPEARALLDQLVGREIHTVTGTVNRVLNVTGEQVIVATDRAPAGEPVPIAWVQDALDLLAANGEIVVSPAVVRHRSAFIGAVLLTLPGASISGAAPPRIALSASSSRGNGAWDISLGEETRRVELHDRYGGSRQGGTIPSRSTPNIFLFLDKKVGVGHGYYDGWAGDRFYYTGHGQTGDQEFHRGNLAVLNHASSGKALRVFRGVRGHVTYLGEFRLDPDQPYFEMEAPEAGSNATRQVIVFRLIPVGDAIRDSQDDVEFPEGVNPAEVDAAVTGATPAPIITEVPVEQQNVEELEVSRPSTSYTVQRREQTLVLEYCAALEAAGHQVTRFRIRPPGEARELISDIYEKSRNNLIEAKGTGSRGEIRMALGQIFDYRRFIEPAPSCAVLLPAQPRPDVEQLLRSAGVAAIWKSEHGFIDNAGGQFTP
jgi:hypothetical protein